MTCPDLRSGVLRESVPMFSGWTLGRQMLPPPNARLQRRIRPDVGGKFCKLKGDFTATRA